MALVRHHPRIWIYALAAAAALLAAVGLLAAMSGSASRGALLAALERPAKPAAATVATTARGQVRDGTAILRAGAYGASLHLAPNHASTPNRVSLALTMGDRPLTGARVTLTFGMPAMGMTDAYSSPLAAGAGGVYTVHEPVLGMPGLWQLHLHVVPAHGAPFDLAVDDTLVG